MCEGDQAGQTGSLCTEEKIIKLLGSYPAGVMNWDLGHLLSCRAMWMVGGWRNGREGKAKNFKGRMKFSTLLQYFGEILAPKHNWSSP